MDATMFGTDGNTLALILMVISAGIAFVAQWNVKRAYEKYVQIANRVNVTGFEVAKHILSRNGITDVKVIEVPGFLSDHYNPSTKTVALSKDIYHGRSISAISVAAHEVGHAIQHARAYYPVVLRGKLIPVTTISSNMAVPICLAGLLLSMPFLIDIGIVIYSVILLFHLVTLPVEFNASSRALVQLSNGFIANDKEKSDCQKMLKAAALTYVASMVVALMQLIRLILIRNSRR